jgi:hypothetical protein
VINRIDEEEKQEHLQFFGRSDCVLNSSTPLVTKLKNASKIKPVQSCDRLSHIAFTCYAENSFIAASTHALLSVKPFVDLLLALDHIPSDPEKKVLAALQNLVISLY